MAFCLIAMVYYLYHLFNTNKPETTIAEEPPQQNISEKVKNKTLTSNTIPDDVVFDNNNLPVRATRSRKKKVNYGKDFNAYLVKGGTIYHKRSCKKLNGKKITTRHIYDCIADDNKRPCPICKPRTEIHEWYKAKFPDSIYVTSTVYFDDSFDATQISLLDFIDTGNEQE